MTQREFERADFQSPSDFLEVEFDRNYSCNGFNTHRRQSFERS